MRNPLAILTVWTVSILSGLRVVLMSRERVTRPFDMSQERITYFFYISRERITGFFDVSREMDPRASSGKFCCVKSRYPESFRFLGLWVFRYDVYDPDNDGDPFKSTNR